MLKTSEYFHSFLLFSQPRHWVGQCSPVVHLAVHSGSAWTKVFAYLIPSNVLSGWFSRRNRSNPNVPTDTLSTHHLPFVLPFRSVWPFHFRLNLLFRSFTAEYLEPWTSIHKFIPLFDSAFPMSLLPAVSFTTSHGLLSYISILISTTIISTPALPYTSLASSYPRKSLAIGELEAAVAPSSIIRGISITSRFTGLRYPSQYFQYNRQYTSSPDAYSTLPKW